MRSLIPDCSSVNPRLAAPRDINANSGTLTRCKNSSVSIISQLSSADNLAEVKEGAGSSSAIMRWKSREFLSEKTFLVIKDHDLTVFEGGSSTSDLIYNANNNKSPRSKQKATSNAGTWPPKLKKNPSSSSSTSSSTERPKTANLDQPNLLDPRLVDKLDMSMLSKELLLDSMTHIKLVNGGSGVGVSGGIERRRQSLNIPACPGRRDWGRLGRPSLGRPGYNCESSNSGIISLARQKRKSFEPVTDSETYNQWRDTSPEIRSPATMKKQSAGIRASGSNEAVIGKRSTNAEGRSRDDNNNKRTSATSLTSKISALAVAKKKSSKTSVKSDIEVFTGTAKSAPEPCKTCGRSDQPERFHSHPKNAAPVKTRDTAVANTAKPKLAAVPKTVQKPVALNFRSEKRKAVKTDANANVGGKNQPDIDTTVVRDKPQSAVGSPKRGPRSVTCYICSREFGTASFPIHEPKCLQKWERENNALPPSQRRPAPPQRPEVLPGHQGWNKAAWEQSQAQLLPCARCGRTFLPDRLPVHEKSCKTQRKNPGQKDEPEERIRASERSGVSAVGASGTSVSREPPMVFCQICGRSFGSRSIKIHEPQCLKRWQSENNGLPPPQRKNKDPATPTSATSSSTFQETHNQIPQKKTIPCYICGRDFGSTSIAIHEPQCLRKWHQENDKLPSGQRRKEPEKPDIVFTPEGDCDFIATFHRIWENHLNSLIPCRTCGRTFRSEALIKHEPNCDASYYRRRSLGTIKKKQKDK